MAAQALTAVALPLEGGRNLAKTASGLCTAALWQRLTDSSETADQVVRRIARSDRMMAEIREIGAELQARAAPATAIEILQVLIELGPTYGIRDLTDAEYDQLFAVYIRALSPLPIETIRAGIVIWSRDGNGYFPKPEQIYQRAEPLAHPLRMAAYRAKKARTWVEDNPPPKSAEERAADRREAIRMGILNEDGTVNLLFRQPVDASPRETPQQAADRLRRIADGVEKIETAPLADEIEEAI